MTHEYTLLVGGIVVPGAGLPTVTALAWAHGTIIALGSDDDVRAISRGDSHLVDLRGAWVVSLGPDAAPGATADGPEAGPDAAHRAGPDAAPEPGPLEIGSPADIAMLDGDPRRAPADGAAAGSIRTLALVRGGHVVAGSLPGLEGHGGPWPGTEERRADPGAGPATGAPPSGPGGRPTS